MAVTLRICTYSVFLYCRIIPECLFWMSLNYVLCPWAVCRIFCKQPMDIGHAELKTKKKSKNPKISLDPWVLNMISPTEELLHFLQHWSLCLDIFMLKCLYLMGRFLFRQPTYPVTDLFVLFLENWFCILFVLFWCIDSLKSNLKNDFWKFPLKRKHVISSRLSLYQIISKSK